MNARLPILFALIALAMPAHAAEPAPSCVKGFTQMQTGGADYSCAAPALTCRKDWFVGGADSAEHRLSSYFCKVDVTEVTPQVGRTPAVCADGFHPNPASVRNDQGYICEAVHPIITPECGPGYTVGPLMLAGKPLSHANTPAGSTLRRLDHAQLGYSCTRQ
ncbi:MAG: hypothetical protein KGI68_15380 [Alphaproteobacteria bacterium]|nr:hypothetical protein [Alphaproteobacteria bacterium]MDE1987917.1 hypothetical protein [Alphaproteobacteria bacterium]MDE2264859.1 hypothetical protein [Alphaproteobacteria bacterium]MDE2500489.1 hypothetical protein [Alphaproteobacteria bacterium]